MSFTLAFLIIVASVAVAAAYLVLALADEAAATTIGVGYCVFMLTLLTLLKLWPPRR